MPSVEKEKLPLTIQEMAEQKYTLEERLKPLPEEDWYKGIYQDCLRNPLGADCLAYLLKRNGKSTEIPHWDTGEPTGVTVEEYAGLLRKAPTMMTPDHYVKKNQEVENVVKTKFYAVVPKDLTENYQAYWEDYVYFDIAERAANGILDRTYYWFLFEGLFRGNNFRDSFEVKKYLISRGIERPLHYVQYVAVSGDTHSYR